MGDPRKERPKALKHVHASIGVSASRTMAALEDLGIVVEAAKLKGRVTLTPRRPYYGPRAYLKLWSPSEVDPGRTPPTVRFPAGARGGLEVNIRAEADTAYVVECDCRGAARMNVSITVGGAGSTLVQDTGDGRFAHAFAPQAAGARVKMMLASADRWTWSECTITPART